MKWAKRLAKALSVGVVVALLAFLGLPYLIPVPAYDPAMASPFPDGEFRDIDGVRLHYRVWEAEGEKAGKVCLVHGFCGSTYSWEGTAAWLASQGYDVVAPDLPAFGYSDRRPGIDHSDSNRARLVWELLDAVGGERPVPTDTPWILVGHSMGGRVIGAMAQTAPDSVEKLVFVDATYGPRNPGGPGWKGAVLGFGPLQRWVEIVASRTQFTEDNIRALLTSAFGEEPDDAAVQGYLAPLQVPGTAPAILDQFAADEPLHHNPQAITAPALLIWGESDTWVPLRAGKILLDDLPNARLETIEGAGHNPMETHPASFRALLLPFLQGEG